MKIGITYRYAEGPTGRMDRLYIPGEFKNIFDELDDVVSNNKVVKQHRYINLRTKN